ncbi:Serine/threonine-protein kinase [Dirofilaria immitis]
MYRNETLLLEGDSIWGSITLLLSSLLSRPCTGLERAQFYEHMLLKSLEKQDKAILLLLKFFESKLREAIDASDEIMRFLLLLSTIFDNYADKSQIKTSPRCSGSEILSVWKQTVNKYLSVSTISKNHAVTSTEPFTDRTNIPSIIYQQYKHLDRNFLKNIECYEKIRRIIVDERGRIHPRACDPELRSLCKLRIGDVFYIVPWHEYLRCLVHVLMGEESILFRKNVDGFFSFSKKNKIFLELEDINLLQRLSLPFLKFANRRDDLESWLYVMVELSSGTLPWKTPSRMKGKKKQLKEQVYKAKLRIRFGDERKKFLKNSLPIFDYILMIIDELTLEADPPYDQIQYIFEKLMLEADVKWDDIYDWEETEKMQSKQSMSSDRITSTSTAIAIYSRYRPTQFRVTTTITASTESSSLLPNV